MNVNQKIKTVIEERGLKLTELAKRVEMSKQNLSRILQEDDLKVSQLEKLSQALGLPVTYFFQEEPKGVNQNADRGGVNVAHSKNSDVRAGYYSVEGKTELENCYEQLSHFKELIEHYKVLLQEKKS